MKSKKYLILLMIIAFVLSGCSKNDNANGSESISHPVNNHVSDDTYNDDLLSVTTAPTAEATVDIKVSASPSPVTSASSIYNMSTPYPTSSIEVTYIPGVSTPLPPSTSPKPIVEPTKEPVINTESSASPIIDEAITEIIDNSYVSNSTPIPNDGIVAEDVYDIFLFFGQSNMNSWPETGAVMPPGFDDIHQYSIDSGIDEDILSWTVSTSEVKVPIIDGSAYMYMYLSNTFEPIKSEFISINGEGFFNSGYIGDVYENSYGGLYYNPDNEKLEQYHVGDPYVSCQVSANQTMIPEFCRKYYELTGHKVITVLCSVGGAPIECFLPSDDPYNYYNTTGNIQHYMYEGLVENFNGAVALAESKNFNIGGKYWICFQGEGNLGGTTLYSYYDLFMKVKNNMAHDIGTTNGAIVYTSNEIGVDENGFDKVLYLHDIQTQLAANNDDIFIGSSFDYDYFIPSEEVYLSDKFITSVFVDELGNKLSYEEAYSMAEKLTSYEYDFFDSGSNNRIHLLSCTLSQIGRDCAISFANELGF